MKPKYAWISSGVTFSNFSYASKLSTCRAYRFVWSTIRFKREAMKNNWKIPRQVWCKATLGPKGIVQGWVMMGEVVADHVGDVHLTCLLVLHFHH